MTKDELINKLQNGFDHIDRASSFANTKWVMEQVDEYVKSLAPAKEVIPRMWAEYIEKQRKLGVHDDELIYGADGYLAGYGGFYYPKFIRAVANGYTIEPEKKYVLPMPISAQDDSELKFYARKREEADEWMQTTVQFSKQNAVSRGYAVTQAQIDAAPAWVKALKPVEVEEDDN